MTQHQILSFSYALPTALDRATYEREYQACVSDYLHGQLSYDEARAVLQRSESLTLAFAAVVGKEEANRTCNRLLERTAAVFIRVPEAG